MNNSIAGIIRAFLSNPLERVPFDKFFGLCHSETISYLRLLRSTGWRLPEEQVQQENTLSDLAYDILGAFFASRGNKPFFIVFAYFERHGLTDIEQIDSGVLLKKFLILLRGFIRKELTLLRGAENPQIKNLKRRIKDILVGPEYCTKEWPDERTDYIFIVGNKNCLRSDLPPITSDFLIKMVREAFALSRTRTEWCGCIFKFLNDRHEFRNAIPLSELLKVMIAVNVEYADSTGFSMGHVSTPSEDSLRKLVYEAISDTMDRVESEVVKHFVDKEHLVAADVPKVMDACRTYLQDYFLDGNTDEIPKYFRAYNPEISQSIYVKKYKYVMEKAIKCSLDEIREKLRKYLIIRPFSGYIYKEE